MSIPTLLSVAREVKDILPHANGGTDVSSPGASGNVLTSDGTDWTSAAPATSPFKWGFYAPGQYASDQMMVAYCFTDPFTFPANWGGGSPPAGGYDVLPTATVTFTIKKLSGGVTTTVGTVAISTGGVFTFATTGGAAQSFANGDQIQVYNQSPADASFAGLRFPVESD